MQNLNEVLLLFAALYAFLRSEVISLQYWDYIVIGAGPGGLQIGYYLDQAKRDYVIFERGNVSGDFFNTYPRHDKLISINKRFTGQSNREFNLRHDWNSLLSHDQSLLFREYSKDFFPHRKSMLKYLNDYEKKLHLNVVHNTEILHLKRTLNQTGNVVFTMQNQYGHQFVCKYLILATGMWKPNIPKYRGMDIAEGYENVSTNPEDFEGKNVLVLGHGNAAFETADAVYTTANMVHLLGRNRVRLSWETHYVGDVRGINNNLLDTYQLKSLDGVLEGNLRSVKFFKKNNKIYADLDKGTKDNFALRDSYDSVIRCLGFTFDESLFQRGSKPHKFRGQLSKYPKIDFDFQSTNLRNLYVVGTASHGIDHRKSAGGFIHGFRYTARTLSRILDWRNHFDSWPSVKLPITELLSFVLKRINEGSGLYQMFGILGDVIAIRDQGESFEFYEEFPLKLLPSFNNITGHQVSEVIVIVMQYGTNFSGPGKDVFSETRATGFAHEAHKSNFLHPVFYHYKSLPSELDMTVLPKGWDLPIPNRIHHIVEDFLTQWTASTSHILPLRRFLEMTLQTDLRHFNDETCIRIALTHAKTPISCRKYFNEMNLLNQFQNTLENPKIHIHV